MVAVVCTFPADAGGTCPRPATTRPTFSGTLGARDDFAGWIDATPTDGYLTSIPSPTGDAWKDALAVLFTLPVFTGQLFAGLPDGVVTALDGPAPIAPAVEELAHDTADYKGIAAVGLFRNAGVFTVRLSLTDVGGAKLRAALSRRSPHPTATPIGSAAGSPATSPTR